MLLLINMYTFIYLFIWSMLMMILKKFLKFIYKNCSGYLSVAVLCAIFALG